MPDAEDKKGKGKGTAGKDGKDKGKDKGEKGNRKGDWKGDGGKGKKDGGYKGEGKSGKDKDDGGKGSYKGKGGDRDSDKGKGGYRDRGEKGDMDGVQKERVARGNIKNMFEKVSHEDGSSWGVPEISKKLSWLLRRGQAVVETSDDGWVLVSDILKFEGLPKLTVERLLEVANISNAEKLRYDIEGYGADQKMRAAGDKTAAAIAQKAAREAKERWQPPSRDKGEGDSAPAAGESEPRSAAASAAAAQGLNSEAPAFKPSGMTMTPEQLAMQQYMAQQQAMQQYMAQVQYMQQLQAMQQMQAMQALQARGAQGKGDVAKDKNRKGSVPQNAGQQLQAAKQMQAAQMQQMQAMQMLQQMKGSGMR